MKQCNICKVEKDFNSFYSNGYTDIGTKKYKPACKSCTGKQVYQNYVKRIKECLQEQDREFKCERCGYDEHSAALVFHHPAEKNFEISGGKTRCKKALYNEIKLCEVLCANCHTIEHSPYSMKQ